MGPLTPTSGQALFSTQPLQGRVDQSNPQFRDRPETRARLDIAQAPGDPISRSKSTTADDERKNSATASQSYTTGSRRGSVLDITA